MARLLVKSGSVSDGVMALVRDRLGSGVTEVEDWGGRRTR